MAVVELRYDIKAPSWVTGNTNVPELGEPVYLTNGNYAFGDGVTQVQNLTFYGGVSAVYTAGTGLQLIANQFSINSTVVTLTGSQALTNKTGNISMWTNDVGYLTAAVAASTYLTTSSAASTYVPYTGATTTVDLGSQQLLTTGGIGINATPTNPFRINILLNQNARTAIRLENANAGSASGAGMEMATNAGNALVFLASSVITTYTASAVNLVNFATGGFDFLGSTSTTLFRINDSGEVTITTGSVSGGINLRSLVSGATYGALYLQGTPTANNAVVYSNGTITNFNSASSIFQLQESGNTFMSANRNSVTWAPVATTSGSTVPFTFTLPASTGQTASTELIGVNWAANTIIHLAGSYTTQRDHYWRGRIHNSAGASVITHLYTGYFEAASVSGSLTATNNYALGTSGRLHVNNGSSGINTFIFGTNINVEHSATNYLAFNQPDAQYGGIIWGSPTDTFGAYIRFQYTAKDLEITTSTANARTRIGSGSDVFGLTLTSTVVTSELVFRTVDGSVSAPSHSFTSETNTGLYYASGTPRFAVKGSKVMEWLTTYLLIGSSPQIKYATHTTGAPSYSFSGDTNTGIGSGTADTLELVCGAVAVQTLTTTAITLADAVNLVFNTTTGTKIATATSQKLAFWNATPIVQPTTAVAAATFVANTSGTLNDSATWDGYTIGQVVKALRNTGLLA